MGAVRPNSGIRACAAIRSAAGEDSSRHVLEIQPWALIWNRVEYLEMGFGEPPLSAFGRSQATGASATIGRARCCSQHADFV
jgi:hypothetical protein